MIGEGDYTSRQRKGCIKMKKKQLDMLHGSLWNKIPIFALPIAATAILEQLFNPVFDSCTYKNPSKMLIYSALFEGLFALKM